MSGKTSLALKDKLRPTRLNEFIGQEKVVKNLKVFIDSAKKRNDILDHTIFYGPPGLGKTTLAFIIANELQSQIYATSGPVIQKPIDLLSILTNLSYRDILFIDEIHRIPKIVEEYLYSALEDFKIDIPVETEKKKDFIRIRIQPFTLIGATTRIGMVGRPLRERFGISFHLDFYEVKELVKILKRTASILDIKYSEEKILWEIAARARGTPRIANNLLKRVWDFAISKGKGIITMDITTYSFKEMGIDEYGLTAIDKKILKTLYTHLKAGPLGIKTIANIIGEDIETIETVYEPYLLKEGLIKKTPRGRIITEKGLKALGII